MTWQIALVPNNRASKYLKRTLTGIKREICKVLVVDFNILLSITDITSRQNSIRTQNNSAADLRDI